MSNLHYEINQIVAMEAEIKALEARVKPLRERVKQALRGSESEIYTGSARATLTHRNTYALEPEWVRQRLPDDFLETMVVDMRAAYNRIPASEVDAAKYLAKTVDVLTVRGE